MGGRDIAILPLLCSATEKNHDRLAIASDIDPISRSEIDLQFADAMSDSLDIRDVACAQPQHRPFHAHGSEAIKTVEPETERISSIHINVLTNLDHSIGAIYVTISQGYFFIFLFRIASVRRRSAFNLMKPVASFWS
jgi:hypothetical protein